MFILILKFKKFKKFKRFTIIILVNDILRRLVVFTVS